MVGESVSHYKILRQLGAGGMGVVYEAEDTKLRRHVALKFLTPGTGSDAQLLERFQREARAASALNHPGICTVYAIEKHEQHLFIVMELLEGKMLSSIMGREPIEVRKLIDIGIQIADALESAHSKGIVHRDVKPANIFLNDRSQVKMLDFGLAKIETAARGTAAADQETIADEAPLTEVGAVVGTVAYMSPEQARGKITDARTDLFSLGTVLYQMAAGSLPFDGETTAIMFDAILNRDPLPLTQANASVPEELGRILSKALEKDRNLRYQSATDLKTDLARLKRDLDLGARPSVELTSSSGSTRAASKSSIAVLYFENLGGAKEDEYFRDGITEDIITELSKIRSLNIFSRPTVLTFRDKPVTPAQVGQQLSASHVLTGSLRRAGDRLRINAQLIDTKTDFPLWSERYDREMKDVFEVQDEIARKIAEALRITLSPQEQEELAAKPTDNLRAYDMYLKGKSYARRLTRQDTDFALQMYESAVAQDPKFALAYAAIAVVCAQYQNLFGSDMNMLDRAQEASLRATELQPGQPEVQVAQAWVHYVLGKFEAAVATARMAIERKPDCEGAYFLLVRALFAAGSYQEIADMHEVALDSAGQDYNVYVPVLNALSALGKSDSLNNVRQRIIETLEKHIQTVPEDARARILLSLYYSQQDRVEDAIREASLAMVLRPDDGAVLYNAACVYCNLNKKTEAMDALVKAHDSGMRDPTWARRDPDLAILHGEPEFERLFPELPIEREDPR
jgi:serine/threonine protein kinase/tetratricopeptide (TPR) repeat protein